LLLKQVETTSSKRFVMLDRDGTIIEERHYLSEPDQVKLIPGAMEAFHAFHEMGLGQVVVTNQSGLGRGLFDGDQLGRVHTRLLELLGCGGIELDGIYFCPHCPSDGCTCRKPETGMVVQAARDLGFVPGQGFVVGDKACDIELGDNIGATTFLVRTGYGSREEAELRSEPDFIVDSLEDTVPIIKDILMSTSP
jgi:D-glycero-D-manno-heptose 1,7-bisphosphate phosphatase